MRHLAILILLAPTVVSAQTFDFNVRDSAAWARYSSLVSEQSFGQLEADGTLFIADGSRRALGAGLHVVDNAYTAETPVYVGLGGRLLWVDAGPADGAVLALGGHGRYTLPDADRVSIGGHLYFAPSILSFAGATRYLEFGLRGEYHLLESSWVYLGYRRTRAGFDTLRTRTFDNGVHLGLRFQF